MTLGKNNHIEEILYYQVKEANETKLRLLHYKNLLYD